MARTPSRLEREIRQQRPFATLASEVVVGVLRTADHLARHLAAVIEPAGITQQQYNVLRILRGAGEAGLPTLEIGVRMIEQTPGVTRLLDRLEAKRLVRRERCPHDRRQVLCWITPAGLELLAALDQPLLDRAELALGRLSRADRRRVADLLDAIRLVPPTATRSVPGRAHSRPSGSTKEKTP